MKFIMKLIDESINEYCFKNFEDLYTLLFKSKFKLLCFE